MSISSKLFTLMLTGLLALCIGPACYADNLVFYSTLGSGADVYDSSNNGWPIYGAASPDGPGYQYALADPFTPINTGYFTELDIALSYVNGDNSVVVDLMSNEIPLGPGSVLDSWVVSDLPPTQTCCTLQMLSSTASTPLLLTANTPYWVAVFPGGSDTYAGWDTNSTGVDTTIYANYGNGWTIDSGGPAGAFEVQGDTSLAPEPSTLSLFGTGLLGLAGWLRRKACR
jgi:hypothetical protein